MPTTPSRRGQPPVETPSSIKKRLNGLWDNDNWWCTLKFPLLQRPQPSWRIIMLTLKGNCKPRRRAVTRQVKKADSPNKGKFFLTCGATSRRCDMFLWQDEAILRQTGLNGQQQQPQTAPPVLDARPQTPTGNGPSSSSSSSGLSLTQRSLAAYGISPSKRKRRESDDDDVFGLDDWNSDEERQLADLTDRSAEKAKRQSTNIQDTPTAQRSTVVDGLATPRSPTRNLFSKPKTPASASTPSTGTVTSKTVSFEESLLNSSAPGSATQTKDDDDGAELAEQITRLLREKNVDSSTIQSVQGLLATSARKTKGLSRGRDAARAALQDKNAEIAKLKQRILMLENRLTVQDKNLTDAKRNLMKMYESI